MPSYADDKTEAPTPRRRQEARAKGQIARSQDLASAVLLFAAFAGLYFFGPPLIGSLIAMVAAGLSGETPGRLDDLIPFTSAIGLELLRRVGPLLGVLFVVALIVLYAQVGWVFTWQPLMPSFSKVNPLNGIMRLFSARSVMMACINLLKLLFVAFVAYTTLAGSAGVILHAFTFDYHDILVLGGTLLFELGMKLSAALLVLALIDFAWQRYRHERDLRMTKEEVKDELRSMEGDPNIKRRRRQLQLQFAMQRLRKDVPKADVIVTNPTHFAVAIRYDPDAMVAPKVIAKGADYVAIRIRQIAAEFGIPMVERRPLARALYESVEVGQYIPERFYRAVAEILAYIYELTGRSPLRRTEALAG
ncbi:MAG: flagellar biosynthesis protein FlhB [Phycisphaerales bacterium]|nr:flagellar biosynthesis protein FlhB [Phycisphaerales bacterium]